MLLSTLILLPLLGFLIISFFDKTNVVLIRNFSLFWSILIFNISLILFVFYDVTLPGFQLVEEITWFSLATHSITLGIDGLSIFMILLTTFLIPVCCLLTWSSTLKESIKEYNMCFFLLEAILVGVFTSLDLFLFYILFEAVLIPMFFIVGIFGSRERRIRASYLLFIYTLLSSIFMLIAILFIFFKAGTTDISLLQFLSLDAFSSRVCWLAFFLSFAVKMPLVPFHIWLPEAHCEAPTSGSVILAGILLKLGGYGFLRFSICIFPDASYFFSPLIFTISSFGVIYASLTTLQQVDLKKIIAYSSVGHMGLVTIGIFSCNLQGIIGSILLMISHGIVSGALFLCIGCLYERHGTRVIKYYSGLTHTMPLFMLFFIIFTLGNLGLPATSSFIGEFLIILGCIEVNSFASLFAASGMVLGAAYSLWLCNRIGFGNPKQFSILEFRDLTRLEFNMLLPFVFLTFLLGLYPELVIHFLKSTSFLLLLY